MKAIIIDTETTGIALPSSAPSSRQPRIIEFGAVLIIDGAVTTINELIDPGIPISEEITKITGITQEMINGKPKFADVIDNIQKMIESADMVIAHNFEFDKSMIDIEFKLHARAMKWPENRLCTVSEYYPEFGRRVKLSDLYEKKLGKKFEGAHRASNDAMAVYEILEADGLFA